MQRLAERYLSGYDVDGYLKRMREWIDQTVVVRLEPDVLRAWDYADEQW